MRVLRAEQLVVLIDRYENKPQDDDCRAMPQKTTTVSAPDAKSQDRSIPNKEQRKPASETVSVDWSDDEGS